MDSNASTTLVSHSKLRPISWGAVFAGATAALVFWVWLSAGGLAVGLGGTGVQGTDVGAVSKNVGIWAVIAPIIGLFAGGILTGRLSGMHGRLDTAFNGVATWAVTMLAIFYFVGTGVGSIIGGAFSAVGGAAKALGGVAQKVAPDNLGIDTDAIENHINQVLKSTGKPALQPEQLKKIGAGILKSYAANGMRGASMTVQDQSSQVATAVDRKAIVNAITANSDLSRADAESLYTNIESDLNSLRDNVSQKVAQVEEQAKQTGVATAHGAAKALWGLVAAMFLALCSTIAGSIVATRKDAEEPSVTRAPRSQYPAPRGPVIRQGVGINDPQTPIAPSH